MNTRNLAYLSLVVAAHFFSSTRSNTWTTDLRARNIQILFFFLGWKRFTCFATLNTYKPHYAHVLKLLLFCYQFWIRARSYGYGYWHSYQSSLTTLAGNLCPGKYFTFSCVSLMISVNFLPSICSSNTYMVTRSSKFGKRAAFAPTIFAIAEPLRE